MLWGGVSEAWGEHIGLFTNAGMRLVSEPQVKNSYAVHLRFYHAPSSCITVCQLGKPFKISDKVLSIQ